MKNTIQRTIITGFLLCGAAAAHAEFNELGSSARSAGMGDCYVAIADDAYATFYNPAGLGRLHHKEIATTSSRLLMGLSDLNTIDENIISAVYGTQLYGGIGLGIHTFDVSGLYKESTSMLSYGKLVGKEVYLGASMKFMSKDYVPNLYTENAIDFSGESFGRDPVFANGYSKAFMSYDLGSYYQYSKRLALALVAKDITSPDTGLAAANPLPMTTTLGLCYQDEGLLIPLEIQTRSDAITYAAGFERWLFSDQLALRAGLQEGSGNLSVVSCGVSYSYNNIIRFDYGFSMPLSGITNTSGSHRLSLVVSIGKPKTNTFELAKQPRDYIDAVTAFDKGQYFTAYDMFETLIKSLETSRQLKDHAIAYVKEILSRMQANIKANAAPSEVAYAKGLMAYSVPDYEDALNELQVFAGIIPGNTEVNYYIELLKKMLGKGSAKPQENQSGENGGGKGGKGSDQKDEFPGLDDKAPDPMLSNMSRDEYINYKLRNAVTDFNQGYYDLSAKDCLYALRADPNKDLSYVRLGSAYYAMGMRQYAVKAWQKALQLNPGNADLREFMQEKNIPVK